MRFERATGKLKSSEGVYHVPDYEYTTLKAAELNKNIFLTTESRNLKIFCELMTDCNIIVRVLPTSEVFKLSP